MKIRFEPYDPVWKNDFEQHGERISAALSPMRPAIDHIGSTSLGDIAAKPIIDILVGVQTASQLDEAISPMLAAGYTYVEKFTPGMPYRRFFVKLTPLSPKPLPDIIRAADTLAFGREYETVANIHVMEKDSYHWMRHIAFRDYLRAFPEIRFAYEALKRNIAKLDFDDPLEYNTHKEAFIGEHQEKAVAWFLQENIPKAADN